MPIPRAQLVELEDLWWFPRAIRDFATDYLHYMEARFRLHEPAVPLLRDIMRRSGSADIVDLCSGGGGPAAAVRDALAAEGVTVRFTLTDKFPNVGAFRRLANGNGGGIGYVADPVDATRVPRELSGVRTMFNAFHHFHPRDAKSVLRCAVEAGQPIGIFEIPERSFSTIVPLLFTPLFVAFATPFMRPFQWKRLFWTYLVPLVPFTCLWDGIVSQLRAYTPAEALALAEEFTAFDWSAASVPLAATPGRLTYLVGMPKARTP